ncbi:MAG: lactate utilization protein [Oscillospiraceae bacterium]|nr:lactate utilization protein [Oscillospiraceae bacterium]
MANVERTMENLQKRGYQVSRFPNRAAAAQYLLDEIGDQAVGMGGSTTSQELEIYPRLKERGEVFWHAMSDEPDVRVRANAAPVYIMSANGVSETGQIINIDANGNRVANMSFGHERVYIVIGINKIAPTDEMALRRARNIAAPKNVRRIGLALPCAEGEIVCHDCNAPNRLCRSFVTLERKPFGISHFEIVIVDEALGY